MKWFGIGIQLITYRVAAMQEQIKYVAQSFCLTFAYWYFSVREKLDGTQWRRSIKLKPKLGWGRATLGIIFLVQWVGVVGVKECNQFRKNGMNLPIYPPSWLEHAFSWEREKKKRLETLLEEEVVSFTEYILARDKT